MKRDKIYDAVWARPIGEVAKSMRVPVETIQAACKALRIPLPPLFYWINLRAGKSMPKPDLPAFEGPQRYSMGPNDEGERQPIAFRRSEHLLSVEDIVMLTGFKSTRRQCEQLRAMKIPFAVNGLGDPLIPVAFFDGSKKQAREEIERMERHFKAVRRSWEAPQASAVEKLKR